MAMQKKERKVYKKMSEVIADKDYLMRRFSNAEIDYLYNTFVKNDNPQYCYAPTPRDWASFWAISKKTLEKNLFGMDVEAYWESLLPMPKATSSTVDGNLQINTVRDWYSQYNINNRAKIDTKNGALSVERLSVPELTSELKKTLLRRLHDQKNFHFMNFTKDVTRTTKHLIGGRRESLDLDTENKINSNKGAYSILFPVFNLADQNYIKSTSKNMFGIPLNDPMFQPQRVEIVGWKLMRGPDLYNDTNQDEFNVNPPGFTGHKFAFKYLSEGKWTNYISPASYFKQDNSSTIVEMPYDTPKEKVIMYGSFSETITNYIIQSGLYSNRQIVFAIRARLGLEYVYDAFVNMNELPNPDRAAQGALEKWLLYRVIQCNKESVQSGVISVQNLKGKFLDQALKVSDLIVDSFKGANATGPDSVRMATYFRSLAKRNSINLDMDDCLEKRLLNVNQRAGIPDLPWHDPEWKMRWNGNGLPPWGHPEDNTNFCNDKFKELITNEWERRHPGGDINRDLLLRFVSTDPGGATWANQSLGRKIHNSATYITSISKDFDLAIMESHEIEYLNQIIAKYIEGDDRWSLSAEELDLYRIPTGVQLTGDMDSVAGMNRSTECGALYCAINLAPTSIQIDPKIRQMYISKTQNNFTAPALFDIGFLYGPYGNGKIFSKNYNSLNTDDLLNQYGTITEKTFVGSYGNSKISIKTDRKSIGGSLLNEYIKSRYTDVSNHTQICELPIFVLGKGGSDFSKGVEELDTVIKTVINDRKNGNANSYRHSGRIVSDQEILFYLRYKYGIAFSPQESNVKLELEVNGNSQGKYDIPIVRGYGVPFISNYHITTSGTLGISYAKKLQSTTNPTEDTQPIETDLNHGVFNLKTQKFSSKSASSDGFCHCTQFGDTGQGTGGAYLTSKGKGTPSISLRFIDDPGSSEGDSEWYKFITYGNTNPADFQEHFIKPIIASRNKWISHTSNTPGDNTKSDIKNMQIAMEVMVPSWENCIMMSDVIANYKSHKMVMELDDWANYVSTSLSNKDGKVIEVPYEFSGFNDGFYPGYKSVQSLKEKDKGLPESKQYIPCGFDPAIKENDRKKYESTTKKYSTIYISGLKAPNGELRQERPWGLPNSIFNGSKKWSSDLVTSVPGRCKSEAVYMRHPIVPMVGAYISDQLYSCYENKLTASFLGKQYLKHGQYLQFKAKKKDVPFTIADYYTILEYVHGDSGSKFAKIIKDNGKNLKKVSKIVKDSIGIKTYKDDVVKWKYHSTFGGAVIGYILTWLKYGAYVPYAGTVAEEGVTVMGQGFSPLHTGLVEFERTFTIIGFAVKAWQYNYKLQQASAIEDPTSVSLGTVNFGYTLFQTTWSLFKHEIKDIIGVTAFEQAAGSVAVGEVLTETTAVVAARVAGIIFSWWASIIIGLIFIGIDLWWSAHKQEVAREKFLHLVSDATNMGVVEGPYAISYGEIKIFKSNTGKIPIGLEKVLNSKTGEYDYKTEKDSSGNDIIVAKYADYSTSSNQKSNTKILTPQEQNKQWMTEKLSSGKTGFETFISTISEYDCKLLLKIAKRKETEVERLYKDLDNIVNDATKEEIDYGKTKSVPYDGTDGSGNASKMYNKILNSYPNTWNVGFLNKGFSVSPNSGDLIDFDVSGDGSVRNIISFHRSERNWLGVDYQVSLPKISFIYPVIEIGSNEDLKPYITGAKPSTGVKYKNYEDGGKGLWANPYSNYDIFGQKYPEVDSAFHEETFFDDNIDIFDNTDKPKIIKVLTDNPGFNKWGMFIPKGIKAEKYYFSNVDGFHGFFTLRERSYDTLFERKNSTRGVVPQITDKEVVWLIRKKYGIDEPKNENNCCGVFEAYDAGDSSGLSTTGNYVDANCEYVIDLANQVVISALEQKCKCDEC